VNAQEKIAGQMAGHDLIGDEFDSHRTAAGRRRWRMILLVIVPVVVVVLAVAFYLNGGRYEDTENAYIQAGRVGVSASISGRVIAVAVSENQEVKTGQLLFRIDPAPFQAEVDRAQAELSAARLQAEALRANYAEGESQLADSQERTRFADRELARQKELLAEGISSQAQYDQAALNARTTRQGIQTTQQQNASVLANLAGRPDLPLDQFPAVQRARAALNTAKLNLGYTEVRAAQDGVVTKVIQLQVGNYVQAARPLFWLVGKRIWIEANFKEDQLDHMRLGQPATIRIDAFPSLDLHAHVSSFSPGTGNSFSVLPPENATGNWVKVVQRLPVQLTLDNIPAGVPIQPGLSADVVVDTGFRRHLFGGGTEAPNPPPPAR
jgi:membrane fusion protein (multidrug efflux system)